MKTETILQFKQELNSQDYTPPPTHTQAASRETQEETGILLDDFQLIHQGINHYQRYRHLLLGHTNQTPANLDPTEVTWAHYIPLTKLKHMQQSGEQQFVTEFFKDTQQALKNSHHEAPYHQAINHQS